MHELASAAAAAGRTCAGALFVFICLRCLFANGERLLLFVAVLSLLCLLLVFLC